MGLSHCVDQESSTGTREMGSSSATALPQDLGFAPRTHVMSDAQSPVPPAPRIPSPLLASKGTHIYRTYTYTSIHTKNAYK